MKENSGIILFFGILVFSFVAWFCYKIFKKNPDAFSALIFVAIALLNSCDPLNFGSQRSELEILNSIDHNLSGLWWFCIAIFVAIICKNENKQKQTDKPQINKPKDTENGNTQNKE